MERIGGPSIRLNALRFPPSSRIATFSLTPSSLAFATALSIIFCASSEEMLCFFHLSHWTSSTWLRIACCPSLHFAQSGRRWPPAEIFKCPTSSTDISDSPFHLYYLLTIAALGAIEAGFPVPIELVCNHPSIHWDGGTSHVRRICRCDKGDHVSNLLWCCE